MKAYIQKLIENAVAQLYPGQAELPALLKKQKIERSKDRAHGDFASNAALLLARPLKQPPRKIAEALCAKLEYDFRISKVESAGPGFINFFVNHNYLAEQLEKISADPRLGVPVVSAAQTIVVDYSAPNVAKEMAVHHLRSTVIGDAVVRVLEFLGHKVIRANHIGDWGTQFGMLIAYLEKQENESGSGMALEDFEAFYREAKRCYDEDENFAQKARSYVVKLQHGDQYCLHMWKKLVSLTMDQNQQLYERLDITLTPKDIMGESLYNNMLPGIITELQQQGLAVENDGALVVYLPQFKNKDGEPLGNIVRKKDGGYLYTTTDLACVKYRVEKLHAQRILYFTDSRQQQHLETVWAIARKAGWVPTEVSLEHCPFGMMLGKDGKPFKTRSGGTVKLKELLDEAESRVQQLLEERQSPLSGPARAAVIHNVAMGAIKYADLSKNRCTDYIFDWDQMLSFDGNTAPYLQYAYSRIRSIFRKGGAASQQEAAQAKIILEHEGEQLLAGELVKFSDAVTSVGTRCLPSVLCTYLYELANTFMHFYEACPVLKDGVSAQTRQSRLALCALTAKILKLGLGLLGIKVMEQM